MWRCSRILKARTAQIVEILQRGQRIETSSNSVCCSTMTRDSPLTQQVRDRPSETDLRLRASADIDIGQVDAFKHHTHRYPSAVHSPGLFCLDYNFDDPAVSDHGLTSHGKFGLSDLVANFHYFFLYASRCNLLHSPQKHPPYLTLEEPDFNSSSEESIYWNLF